MEMIVSIIIFSSRNSLLEDFITMHDSDDGFDSENRKVGTWMFDEYPTYDEWIHSLIFTKPADMTGNQFI